VSERADRLESRDPTGPEKILIVDDDQQLRDVLEKGLRRLGYEVVVAVDGNQGLMMAIEARPQVIFTDVQMPGMDGNSLIRHLTSQNSEAVVVLMSGGGLFDDVFDGLRAGAICYLKKPWTTDEFHSAMNRATQEYQKRSRLRRCAAEAKS
jgi:DNA-binding NtrC family response regulator